MEDFTIEPIAPEDVLDIPGDTTPMSEDAERERHLAVTQEISLRVEQARLSQYRDNADPIFFKWQAGEATEQEWLDARAQVVADNPYPTTVQSTEEII